jgi:hypothetical protein
MSTKVAAQNVRDIKLKMRDIREEMHSTCDAERRKFLKHEEDVVRNQIYDAVHNLKTILKEEFGIDPWELPDLLQDHGYAAGQSIELPKAIQSERMR